MTSNTFQLDEAGMAAKDGLRESIQIAATVKPGLMSLRAMQIRFLWKELASGIGLLLYLV